MQAYYIERDALRHLFDSVSAYQAKKVYLLADIHTEPLAGDRIRSIVQKAGAECVSFIFQDEQVEPDENAVELATAHLPVDCDLVIALGSGVLNDIGKVISCTANVPYIIVATAPSMDGYASATSSMVQNGLKVTLATKCPDIIIGDVELLKTAPLFMAKSGLGDMLAKYVSICEWRISNRINGEYYCEAIASYVRQALQKCIDNADGLLEKRDESIIAVMEGLISCGMAMEYAGLSRPASGVEHYISHICDMRGLEFGTAVSLHGIQCAVATLMVVRLYEKLVSCIPDKEHALQAVCQFDLAAWNTALRSFLGKSAEAMIALEMKEQKYDVKKHADRLEKIIDQWDVIKKIVAEELPSASVLEGLLDQLSMPKTLEELGIDAGTIPMILKASKDMRDKYVLTRLLWDLGLLDRFCTLFA